MKKIILTFICCLMLNQVTIAGTTSEPCANGGGWIFKGVNGKTYCKSKFDINWWNAVIWCRANGMELVNLSEDCDCPTDICTTSCPNLKPEGTASYFWTHVPYSDKLFYTIGHYGVTLSGKNNSFGKNALCVKRETTSE